MTDSQQTQNQNTASSKRSFLGDLLDYIEVIVIAICFVILLFSFGFRLCTVSGPSMEKTLHDGEQLIVSNLFYEPKPDDIVVFHQVGTLNEPVVKRVIAVEGETVRIQYENDSMTVTVISADGEERELDESSYMYYDLEYAPIPEQREMEYVVGEGQLFVMGDNRNHSTDSRSKSIGLVDTRSVLGKVVLRVTPFHQFGTVD